VIWDSGDLLDRIAMAAGSYLDDRSDDKSIEPENVTVGQIGESLYAFVGLERSNGMVSFDITNPYAPTVARYLPNGTGIVSPEGLLFIPAASSPNGQPLLVSSNEVSKDLEVLSLAEGFDSRGLSGRARRTSSVRGPRRTSTVVPSVPETRPKRWNTSTWKRSGGKGRVTSTASFSRSAGNSPTTLPGAAADSQPS
jgi:hypothetical protein